MSSKYTFNTRRALCSSCGTAFAGVFGVLCSGCNSAIEAQHAFGNGVNKVGQFGKQ